MLWLCNGFALVVQCVLRKMLCARRALGVADSVQLSIFVDLDQLLILQISLVENV